MRFTKMHGLGNDFIVIEALDETGKPDYSEEARWLCDRHFGVGADGLLIVQPSQVGDLRMRIFNADGSEPEMCGNGIRCFARYVYEHGLSNKLEMQVETGAGIIVPHLVMGSEGIVGVRVDMGEPRLKPADIPAKLAGEGPVVREKISLGRETVTITALSMGNPHCVIFVPKAEDAPVGRWGPMLEVHEAFPNRTNVEFVEVVSPTELNMRVWERGAGSTLACGTGACAGTVAAVLNDKAERQVTVHLAGGDLDIHWDKRNNHVYMTGPAVEAFRGEVDI